MVVPYPSRDQFIANTDRAWFDSLADKAVRRDALAWHLEHRFKKAG